MRIKRLRILVLLALAIGAVLATTAVAVNAHFINNATSVTRSGNSLQAVFKIAGLGTNVTTVQVTLQADAQCVNPGSNKPKAGNKQTFSASGNFDVDKSGSAEGSLTLTATFQPDCTPPMTVEFSNVILIAKVQGEVVATKSFTGTF
jgi:hypothetical protein